MFLKNLFLTLLFSVMRVLLPINIECQQVFAALLSVFSKLERCNANLQNNACEVVRDVSCESQGTKRTILPPAVVFHGNAEGKWDIQSLFN